MVFVGNEYFWAVVVNWTILPPRGHWQSPETFVVFTRACVEGVTGISSVEARDAAKHPTVQRTGLTTKKDPAPNVNDVQAENPILR